MYGKLLNKIKSTRKNERLFKGRSKYLQNGEYLYNDSLQYVFLNKNSTKSMLFNLFENDPMAKVNIKLIFFKKIFFNKSVLIKDNLEEKDKDFVGSIYLFSEKNKEDKIFDLVNKKVMSFFSNEHEYDKKLNSYNYFSKYFTIPEIIDFSKNKVIEELVTFKDSWSSSEYNFILDETFSKYIKYFKGYRLQNRVIYLKPKYLLQKIKQEKHKTYFNQTISSKLMNNEFPIIKLHGDLRKNNILLDSGTKDVYFIDWEFTDDYFIFYDLFFLMYHEAIHNDNLMLLGKYLSGDYDHHFETIFNIFNLKYDKSDRISYLNIFFLEHFIKKVKQNHKIYKYYNILHNECLFLEY